LQQSICPEHSNDDDHSVDTPPTLKSTLVVNDVDRFHPPLASWINSNFCDSSSSFFLPRWRIDDGQISLAHKGGSIGPHVDDYDVFLIQMSGSRTWEIGRRFISTQEEVQNLVEGIDVRILKHWNEVCTETLVLKKGDVLYLPPRVPHCGTAATDGCSTLSVGCRAPSTSEMLSRWAEIAAQKVSGSIVERYRDDHLWDDTKTEDKTIVLTNPSVITEDAKAKAKQLILNAVVEFLDSSDKDKGLAFDEFFGKLVTEPKRVRIDYPPSLIMNIDNDNDEEDKEAHEEWISDLGVWGNPKEAVQTILNGEGCLYQAEGVVFAYSVTPSSPSKESDGEIKGMRKEQQQIHRLFVNGNMYEIVASIYDNTNDSLAVHPVCAIANERRLTKESFIPDDAALEGLMSEEVINLLEDLVAKGFLYGSEE